MHRLTVASACAVLALSASAVVAAPHAVHAAPSDPDPAAMPWLDASKSPEARADLLVQAMTNDQLVHMLHGKGTLTGGRTPEGVPYIGYIPPIPELRVPGFVMTDGPAGLRNGEPATAMPAPIAQGASFSPEAARAYGTAIGQDARDRGMDMLFSPGFNLARNPTAGRTFEYLGEDPYLAGTLAGAHVDGLQSTGVMGTLKHFVANNQETNRTQNSSDVDPRTLREIYEKPFQIAVETGRPASVMCAYNKVNGEPACGSKSTLTDDLRKRIGFTGPVLSDYPATWSATDVRDGLNVELPAAFFTTRVAIQGAVNRGEMSWTDVRTRVRETLVPMFRFGLFDKPWNPSTGDRVRPRVEIPAARGRAAARDAAEQGAVLLKNSGILPLGTGANAPRRVLVVGSAAKDTIVGGGSSAVTKPLAPDSTLDQITRRLPSSTVVWKHELGPAGIAIEAKKADVVIVVAGKKLTEVFDQTSLSLPLPIDNAIANAASRNPRTVVVTQIGGPVLMPWLSRVPAVLNVWYPGEAGGEATARLLFGDANPGGRLPQTFPAREDQKPANTAAQFPGSHAGFRSAYSEGVFMGYRWYTARGEKPLFPFGHGLSYTTFAYSDVALESTGGSPSDPVRVSVTVRNTGQRAGDVVPQVYVGKPSTTDVPTPPRELGAYARVHLAPGESTRVTLTVEPRQLAIFDTAANDFRVRPGTYTISVGDDVDDLVGQATYTVR